MRHSDEKRLAEEEAERKAARMNVLSIVVVAVLVALGVWTYLVNRPTGPTIARPRQSIVDSPVMAKAEKDWINEKSKAIRFDILEWNEAPQVGEGIQGSYAGLGKKYVSVKVRATNTSKTEKIYVVAMDLGLVADNGASYKALIALGGKVPPVSFALAPGKSAVGMLAFEVDQRVRNGTIGFLMPE